MEAPADPTSRFFRHELSSALEENGYALMAWEVPGSEDNEGASGQAAHAEARVELLPESGAQGDKGRTVEIQLTLRGYQVRHESKSKLTIVCMPVGCAGGQSFSLSPIGRLKGSRAYMPTIGQGGCRFRTILRDAG